MMENKKCWACKRTLVGDSKLGLCPNCVNKIGTGVTGISFVGGIVWTAGKFVSQVIKKD